MTKRGIVIVSVMFGLFAVSFSVLGIRSLTLGPDAATPSATALTARQNAADALEQRIRTTRADAPPALPQVPARVVAVAAARPTNPAPPAGATPRASYVNDDGDADSGGMEGRDRVEPGDDEGIDGGEGVERGNDEGNHQEGDGDDD